MSWKKLAPVAVALLMALPTAVLVSPASAQAAPPTVAIAPTVPWHYQVGFLEKLYFDFERSDDTGEWDGFQDCATPSGSVTNPTGALEMTPFRLRLAPQEDPSDFISRVQCDFAAGTSNSATILAFESVPTLRSFNVTSNDSLRIEYRGKNQAGNIITAVVQSGDNAGVSATHVIAAREVDSDVATLGFSIPIGNTNRYAFQAGAPIKVTFTVSGPAGAALPDPQNTWSLDDRYTRLEIRSPDSLRAATWTTDQDGKVRDIFEPIPADKEILGPLPRVVGFFAVESALSDAEARGGGNAVFTFVRNGEPVPIGPGGSQTVTGEFNQSSSLAGTGRAVWTFPAGVLDYRGLAAGEYELTVQKQHPQSASYYRGIAHTFRIGTQSARLAVVPGEQLTHEVAPGSSTTYVLHLNNTGSVNDSFAVTAEFVSGTPTLGWGASIGGPGLENNLVRLAPGEQKIITATVTAPFAAVGDSSVFLINAQSTIDTKAQNTSLTVVSRISNAIIRDVGVIAPTQPISFEPGTETRVQVYAWNKGTRPANMTFFIEEKAVSGWSVDFTRSGQLLDRLTLSSVPPGALAVGTLVARGPIDAPGATYDVKLNATNLDAAGFAADAPVRFVVNPTATVRVEVLDKVNGEGHVVQMHPCYTDPTDERIVGSLQQGCAQSTPIDGVEGVWFRTWISNTGRVTDTFGLALQAISVCNGGFLASTSQDETNFRFYVRAPNGERTGITSIPNLPPGTTAEVYVWVKLNPGATYDNGPLSGFCSNSDVPFLRFAVVATGERTKAVGIGEGTVTLVDTTSRAKGARIEAVERLGGYDADSPYVDISRAGVTTLEGPVELPRNATYYVRVTNAAGFREYVDSDGDRHSPNLTVSVEGLGIDSGWNVSIRPRNGETRTDLNPYGKQVYVSSYYNGAPESWLDQEIEVVVTPPRDKTLLAGNSFTFALQARVNDSGTTHTMLIKSIVTEFANVTMAADNTRVSMHPGEPGAFLLLVQNNGSSPATVGLRAGMVEEVTRDGSNWGISLGANTFELPAKSNRTIALLVTPPVGSEGSSGEINVTVEFANAKVANTNRNASLRLFADVVAQDSLSLSAVQTSVTAAPGGFANFLVTLASTRDVGYTATTTPIPNWTTDLSPAAGNILPGVPQTISVTMRVPSDVKENLTFSSILRVSEPGNPTNFDSLPLSINIQGGKPIAALDVPSFQQRTVDRNGVRDFEVDVKNTGNAAGRIRLEVEPSDAAWTATFANVEDPANPYVDLGPNELKKVNVSVRAPLNVPENALVQIQVVAYSPDLSQSARAVIQARIHDYGLSLAISPPSLDIVPGAVAEVVLKLRNRGNDNDTLNVSYVGDQDLPEWAVTVLGDSRIQLGPNEERELRARIQSPVESLPSPRTYNFKFYAGTLGGAAVNFSKNDTATAAISVYRYVAVDVDRDSHMELAVDVDKLNTNGYEQFREVNGEGTQTQVIASTSLQGRTRFLLDVPVDTTDGTADVWFDPEAVYAYQIPAKQSRDVTGDRVPDYLVDTDRDGKVDQVYDSDAERYLTAVEVKVFGDGRVQYLVDTKGDAKPDRYYDPEANVVTDTQRVSGEPESIIGIDTDDDKKVDKYYDTKTGRITDAKLSNFGNFFLDYWYFFVAFAAMLLLTIVLVVRRRRAQG